MRLHNRLVQPVVDTFEFDSAIDSINGPSSWSDAILDQHQTPDPFPALHVAPRYDAVTPHGVNGMGSAWGNAGLATPEFFLNLEDRGGGGPNGKPSLTSKEAGAQIGRVNSTWNGATLGQAAEVTYAFRATAPTTMPNGTAGFSRFNAAQIEQTDIALRSWSDIANVTFKRVDGGNGYSDNAKMLIGNYDVGPRDAAAFAYYPGNGVGGDAWFNISQQANKAPDNLNYGGITLLHELGHALGMSHPGDYNGGVGAPTYAKDADYYEDTRQYSVMSYWSERNTDANHGGYYSSAPLMDDIAAIQRLYGANMATRSGDTVYGFNSNTGRDYYTAKSAGSPLIFAAWDGGGNDLFDFTGFRQNQLIDLNDGHFSNVGGLIGNVSIAEGVTIERAYGGAGADQIIGNEANNLLFGVGGNDRIDGGGGADKLFGGDGADVFIFDSISDSRAGANDHIYDFVSRTDRIDLSLIDADAGRAGDQAFALVTRFTGRAGEAAVRYLNGVTSISLDSNGDGVADFVLTVGGQIDTMADLIL